jgi:hypothetical protein
MQRVQFVQPVAQALRADGVPAGLLLPVVEPPDLCEHGEYQGGEEHPPVGQQPVDHHHHQGDDRGRHHEEADQLGVPLLLALAGPSRTPPRRRPPTRHRFPSGDANRIGYDTVGRGC